jgi:hypothetical protein
LVGGELIDLGAYDVELRLTGYFELSEDFVANFRVAGQSPRIQRFTSQNPVSGQQKAVVRLSD